MNEYILCFSKSIVDLNDWLILNASDPNELQLFRYLGTPGYYLHK